MFRSGRSRGLALAALALVMGVSALAGPPSRAGTDIDRVDPLGLVPLMGAQQLYSVGTDRFGVLACDDLPRSPAEYAQLMEEYSQPWFDFHSRGRYNPEFVAVGTIDGDSDACELGLIAGAVSTMAAANPGLTSAVVITDRDAPDVASVGVVCFSSGGDQVPIPCDGLETNPVTRRYIEFQESTFELESADTIVHEMGHTLNWPHTNTGGIRLDVVGDLMGGGAGAPPGGLEFGEPWGPPLPAIAGTAVYNLYRSGWIDPNEVEIVPGSGGSYDLHAQDAPDGATRMVVIPDGPDAFYVLGAFPGGNQDWTQQLWEGVEIYRISVEGPPVGIDYQSIRPLGNEPSEDAWKLVPLPHVLAGLSGTRVGDFTVIVTGRNVSTFSIDVLPGDHPQPSFGFVDTVGGTFEGEVEAIASRAITLGCNPPDNDRFCPSEPVTRAQMASFLQRAGNFPDGASLGFVDVSQSSPHAGAISAMAERGITLGCNPPDNDRFCPNEPVTRAQMASFLMRAFDLPRLEVSGTNFIDVNNNDTHMVNIANVGLLSITLGCNPPDNNRFCPTDSVTRGQMAAFIERSFTWWKPRF